MFQSCTVCKLIALWAICSLRYLHIVCIDYNGLSSMVLISVFFFSNYYLRIRAMLRKQQLKKNARVKSANYANAGSDSYIVCVRQQVYVMSDENNRFPAFLQQQLYYSIFKYMSANICIQGWCWAVLKRKFNKEKVYAKSLWRWIVAYITNALKECDIMR